MNVLAMIAILAALTPQGAALLPSPDRQHFVETQQPVSPTEAECEIGWQPGEDRWTRFQFEALCDEED